MINENLKKDINDIFDTNIYPNEEYNNMLTLLSVDYSIYQQKLKELNEFQKDLEIRRHVIWSKLQQVYNLDHNKNYIYDSKRKLIYALEDKK